MKNQVTHKEIKRAPVVVIMGHIDHGKSTLLDYIRNSNIVKKEAGGITQHLGAYEIEHKVKDGIEKITFLDTPGHEAFFSIRNCGSKVADIAILIVSAEDGVKPQTLEAYNCIKSSRIPFIVAINKIDSPRANIDSTKNSLLENEIFIEGYGGDVPAVAISAKTGEKVDELLETLLLLAEMHNFKSTKEKPAHGFVIETEKNKFKGVQATLVIKDGSMKVGQFVATPNSFAPIRAIEDYNAKQIKEATFSSPVCISGWSEMPAVGSEFETFNTKKEAENFIVEFKELAEEKQAQKKYGDDDYIIPILFKADTQGSLEAIQYELNKIKPETAELKIIQKATGNINENDIVLANTSKKSIVAGFGVKVEDSAKSLAERLGINLKTFTIIYELTDWLKQEIENIRPRIKEEIIKGEAKILKVFSASKHNQVVGGKVKTGIIKNGNKVKILRRDEEIGMGTIKGLQQAKAKTNEVTEENEFGMLIDSKIEIVPGDSICAFELTER